MKSADIKTRKWSEAERRGLERMVSAQAEGDDSEIDYSDAPALSDEQLAAMVPFSRTGPKVPVSVRLDAAVMQWLRDKGPGHLTRINEILRRVMEAEQRVSSLPRRSRQR